MDINTLRYFLCVVEEGSFSRAAKRLFLSQQGLNKSISSLERAIGRPLLHRNRKGVSLTAEGLVVLKYAEQIVGAADRMMGEVSPIGAANVLLDPPVKIAATKICLHSVLRPFIEQGMFARTSILETTSEEALELACERGWVALTEIVPGAGLLDRFQDRLSSRCLLTTRPGIIFRQSLFPQIGKQVSAQDLRVLPLGIDTNAGIEQMLTQIVGETFGANAAIRSSSLSLLLKAMSEGTCVMVGDSYFWFRSAHPLGRAGDRIAFSRLGDYEVQFVVCWGRDADASTALFANRLAEPQEALDAQAGWVNA